MNFQRGIYLSKGQLNHSQITRLKNAFYDALDYCDAARREASAPENMRNTVHHCLFLADVFEEIVTSDENWDIVSNFFGHGKFVLNSFGGNNNFGKNKNYASEIHRDVRFFTADNLFLNSIICVSQLSEESGATELFLPNDGGYQKDLNEGGCQKYILRADPGDVFYFDSRIWHRAGTAKESVAERIIFTPIYTRPFIKPGFDYSSQLKKRGTKNYSERMKQLCGYYADIPTSHEQWYGSENRRYYLRDQDRW